MTGSPQITYFKVVFKRHTNFAVEAIAQTFSGTVRYGSKVTAVISRNGDLLGDMWLEAVMTRSTGETFYPAEQLVKSITVELGGQQLDKLTSTWYRVYDNLYRNNNTDRSAYKAMTDFVDGEAENTVKRMFVPVLFWFNRSPGNYLPLIALQYHELRVTFEFDSNIPGVKSSVTDALEATLYADYVYLDQQERKKFASQPHEYLIEQIQFTGDENVTVSASGTKAQQIRLSFNHPTKLLAWVVADPAAHGKFTGGFAGATQEALAPLQSAKLMLNGHDRAETRNGAVYNRIVPYQINKSMPDAGVYFMSFALNPTQHAPSGSLNLSRIDSAVLALTFKAADVAGNTTVLSNIANVTAPETNTITDASNLSALRVFAVNYNVLRVMSGMGGLAYSN